MRDAAIITADAAMARIRTSLLMMHTMTKLARLQPRITHMKTQKFRVSRWYFSARRSAERFWVSSLAVSSSCSVTPSTAQMSSRRVMSG